MEKLDIIFWILGFGFSFNFALMWLIWSKIEKMDEKLLDVDRRLCRIEGAMMNKECCLLGDQKPIKKAE